MTSHQVKPKVHPSFDNADPQDFDGANKSCPGSCHSTPKTGFDTKQSPWFFDMQKSNPELTADIFRKLKKKETCDKNDPKPTPAPAAPTANPASPEVQKLLETAAKAEKAAGLAASPELKLTQYQDALSAYKLAQDPEGYKRVLGSMRKEYEKLGQDIAVAKVDAELNFIDGKFEDSIKGYRALEALLWSPKLKLSHEERKAALLEVNLKLSLTLQAYGSSLTKDKKYKEALPYLEEALQRTPSELLTAKVIEAQVSSGKANLGKLKGQIAKLEDDIMRLKTPAPCGGCHTTKKVDAFSNFEDGPAFQFELDADGNFVPKAQAEDEEPSDPRWHTTPKHLRPKKRDELAHLKREDRQRLKFMEESLASLKADYTQAKELLANTVRTGMASYSEGDKYFARELYLADVMLKAGDPEASVDVYQDLLKSLTGPGNEIKRGIVNNQMASVYFNSAMQDLATRQVWTLDFDRAIKTLDEGHEDLKNAPDDPQRSFLMMQNRFLKAEIMMSKAHTQEEAAAGKAVLEQVYLDAPGFDKIPADDPRRALIGRIRLRMAQWHYGQTEKTSRSMGDHYVSEILREHKGDAYLESQAKLSRGLATLRAPGKSIEGLRQLRQVQLDYPGSEADQVLRRSDTIANLRDSDGVLKEKISESDFGEALKVALDRSSEGSGARKAGFAVAGALVAVLFWEVSIPILLIGGGAGYFAEKGVSIAEHSDDIADAYQSGISNVDGGKHIQNLFMLGLDVAMLVTAGAGGAVARQGTKALLSLGARELAPMAAPLAEGIGTFTYGALALRGLAQAGKGAMYLIPAAVDSTAAYTIYKGERALLLGEKFEWSGKEALLMFAMCESFAMAHRLGVGTQWAAQSSKAEISPILHEGKLAGFKDAGGQELKAVMDGGKIKHFENAAGKKYSPVYHEGKLIGATDTAGRLIGWGTDVVIGATGYYGLLLGIQATGGEVPGGIHAYDVFLADQLKTLGALHLGSKLAHKVGNGALDKALIKLDRRSNEWLKEAKERVEKGGGDGGGFGGFGFGLVPVLAGGGAGYGPGIGRVLPDGRVTKGPTIMMMENNGNGGGDKEKFWKDLEDFELTLLNHDLEVRSESVKQPIKKGNPVEIKLDLKSPAELDIIAGALQGKLAEDLKTIAVTVDRAPTFREMVEIAKATQGKSGIGIEIHVRGAKGSAPYAKTSGGTIVLAESKIPTLETVLELQKIAQKEGVSIAYEKTSVEPFTIHVTSTQVRVESLQDMRQLVSEAIKSGGDLKIHSINGNRQYAKLEKGVLELDFKSEPAERIELIQGLIGKAMSEGRDLKINAPKTNDIVVSASGTRKKVAIAGAGTVEYVPASGHFRSKVQVELAKAANPEAVAMLIGSASEMQPALLEGATLTVTGLPAIENTAAFKPIRQSLNSLVQKALWAKVADLNVGNKDIYLSAVTTKGSTLKYSFETKLPIQTANSMFAEYLAFEAGSSLGLKGPGSPEHTTLLNHFRSAMNQATHLHANADLGKIGEYEPYVQDGRTPWLQHWTQSVEAMINYAKEPSKALQLLDTMNTVREYSQPERGHLLGFKDFDGRAYADNSFELMRIFEYSHLNSSVKLNDVLGKINTMFGKTGSVEVYGGGIGLIFKSQVPNKLNPAGTRLEVDKAAVNEYNRFNQMKQDAVVSGEAHRFTILPEDRMQGSNHGTGSFTKTPEWIVEKLGSDGSVERMLTVEVTQLDGMKSGTEDVWKTIDKKVDQVQTHQFNKEHNQKDALISITFYRGEGREAELLKEVQDALTKKHGLNARVRAGLEKTRVMVTIGDQSSPVQSKTYWLEYQGRGQWVTRKFEGSEVVAGPVWTEALPKAMAW